MELYVSWYNLKKVILPEQAQFSCKNGFYRVFHIFTLTEIFFAHFPFNALPPSHSFSQPGKFQVKGKALHWAGFTLCRIQACASLS